MKLNEFTQKSRKVKKKTTQFVLQNDAAELKFKKQIDELDAELGRYRTIEAERDKVNASLQLEQKGSKELKELTNSLSEELETTKLTLEAQEKSLSKISEFKETIQNLTTELSSTRSELKTMTKTAFSQSKNMSELGRKTEHLQKDNDALEISNRQALANKLSAEVERERVVKENEELQSSDTELKLLRYKFPELRDLNKDKQNSRIVANKISSEIERDQVLKEFESFTNETSKINRGVQKKKIVNHIKNLIEELTYLRKLNKDYRIKARPSYVSMGAIAIREGFKMPNGKENIRTHNLGNSAPKLLKFKAEGVNNDN